jgi:hypothetical protein
VQENILVSLKGVLISENFEDINVSSEATISSK